MLDIIKDILQIVVFILIIKKLLKETKTKKRPQEGNASTHRVREIPSVTFTISLTFTNMKKKSLTIGTDIIVIILTSMWLNGLNFNNISILQITGLMLMVIMLVLYGS